jgi:N-acetylglucosamine-6-phosphate deacetylase
MPQELRFRGFFDLQVNGFKGVDFSSGELTEEAFVFACRELLKKGTVGFLPTIISSEAEVYQKNLAIISKVKGFSEFKRLVPGIHLEGPFISPEDGYRGIHPLKNIKEPDVDFLNLLIKWSGNNIRMMTIAAEKKGAEKLCSYAVSKNIVISLGHQEANEKQINSLARKGAKAMTHLGNGLPHLIHRHLNPIWSGLGNANLAATIIADGFHIPVSVIKTILKVKGVNNTILVSDLSPLGGMKPGEYSIWGSHVRLSPNGFLHDPSTGYLAASSFSLLDSVNYLLAQDIVKLKDIYRMAFHNPLRLLGIHPAVYRNVVKIKLRGKRMFVEP